MKKLLLLYCFLTATMLYAQEDPQRKNEQIESMRIAYITRNLNLTPKEATGFWPVYNEFNQQITALRMKDRERTNVFRAKMNPDDQESEKFIADHMSFKQQEFELTRKYVNEFKKVLPMSKVATLVTLDQEFKKQLLQQIKGRGMR